MTSQNNQHQTPETIGRVVRLLVHAYPLANISVETIEVYCALLADLEPERLRAAVLQHIAQSRFFPTVAELRELILGQLGAPAADALAAWGEVMQQVRAVGIYGAPAFADPLTGSLVGALGWRNICNDETGNVANRARFLDAFAARSRQLDLQARNLPQLRELAARLSLPGRSH